MPPKTSAAGMILRRAKCEPELIAPQPHPLARSGPDTPSRGAEQRRESPPACLDRPLSLRPRRAAPHHCRAVCD